MDTTKKHYHEEESSLPLVIFNIGVLGSMPLDVPKRLAEEYDAVHISNEHLQLPPTGTLETSIPSPTRLRAEADLKAQSEPPLADGQDILLDMFFNTPEDRHFPINLAHHSGALAVALCFHTPFRVARRRVLDWTAKGSFKVPVERWAKSPYLVTRSMMKHIKWPNQENIDYVFNLDGNTYTEAILDEYNTYLGWYRLVKSNPSPDS